MMTAAAGWLACGCKSASDAHTFENKVFISAATYAQQYRVQTDEKVNEMTASLTVAMADREEKDVHVVLHTAPELLEKYRKAYYDASAELLPAAHYDASIEGKEIVIPAGNTAADPLTFTLKELMSLDYSTNYVLPLTIATTTGQPVLENARTLFVVVTEASLINVVADMYKNRAWPYFDDFEEVADLETFTMEALVKITAFTNKEINTVMGIEDVFLIRIGDAQIPKNQVQIATARKDEINNTTHRGSVTGPNMKLNTDQWYHIAVTFDHGLVCVYIDGNLKGSDDFSTGDLSMGSINFKVPHSEEDEGKPRCFWVGYSYDHDRSLNGSIAEARLWNRVLSEAEIKAPNHFYKINVKDPEATVGLMAYWKFDDAQGNKVKDWSGYGHDLEAQSAIVWKEVSLPAKNK